MSIYVFSLHFIWKKIVSLQIWKNILFSLYVILNSETILHFAYFNHGVLVVKPKC